MIGANKFNKTYMTKVREAGHGLSWPAALYNRYLTRLMFVVTVAFTYVGELWGNAGKLFRLYNILSR